MLVFSKLVPNYWRAQTNQAYLAANSALWLASLLWLSNGWVASMGAVTMAGTVAATDPTRSSYTALSNDNKARPQTNNYWGKKVAQLLPTPNQLAQIMELGSQVAVVELSKHVQKAGGNPEVLRSVIASVSRGAPNYDARLGISREEFMRYVTFQPDIMPTGRRVRLPLRRLGNRLMIADVRGEAGILRGLSFNLITGELQVPEGVIVKPVPLYVNPKTDHSVNIQGGFKWNLSFYNANTQNGIKGQLGLYKVGDDQVILVYKRFSMIKGRTNEGQVIVKYKLRQL